MDQTSHPYGTPSPGDANQIDLSKAGHGGAAPGQADPMGSAPFGQNQFGQPPNYGQGQVDHSQFGQPQSDQAQFGQPQSDQAQFGQAQFGQGQFGQGQFGQGQFGQAQSGQTPYSGPAGYSPDTRPWNRSGLWGIGFVVFTIVVLFAFDVLFFLLPVFAVVSGVKGIRECQRGAKGLWYAITAIALGAVLTLLELGLWFLSM